MDGPRGICSGQFCRFLPRMFGTFVGLAVFGQQCLPARCRHAVPNKTLSYTAACYCEAPLTSRLGYAQAVFYANHPSIIDWKTTDTIITSVRPKS